MLLNLNAIALSASAFLQPTYCHFLLSILFALTSSVIAWSSPLSNYDFHLFLNLLKSLNKINSTLPSPQSRMDMESEDTTTTTEMEMASSPPVPEVKKKGRRSKKKVQPEQPHSEENGDEEATENEQKPAAKRGRPKKPNKAPKYVKKVKPEPVSRPASPTPNPKVDEDVEMPSASSPSFSTLQEQEGNTTTTDQQLIEDNQIQTKGTKRRRVGGCRRVSKKNGAGGGGETQRVVASSANSKNLIGVEDIFPDELIDLDELQGFEHVEVFNAMLNGYKLDNVQETAEGNNIYSMPPIMQFNGNAVNFGVKQSVSLQMLAKTEARSQSQHMY